MKKQKVLFLFLAVFGFSAASAQASDQDDFRFSFAFRNPTQGGVDQRIEVQAAPETGAAMQRICGENGRLCTCEFQDEQGKVLGRTDAANISYEIRGNYFRCIYRAGKPGLAKVRFYKAKLTSARLPLLTPSTITLRAILGRELDINIVRTVYRYSCQMNFLQKQGTTTQGFDCTNQVTPCDPDGNASHNFCILQSHLPFHLYADNYNSNFWEKPTDSLYNGGGTDRICGLQILRYSCSGEGGTPQAQFGLYGAPTSLWDTSVNLASGPEQISVNYGYAARTSATTGECPPGLAKQVFFKVSVNTRDIFPSHSYPSGLVSTEVRSPTQPPPTFNIDKYAGGSCNGDRCTMPNSYAGLASVPQSYSSSGQTEFCVIPRELLLNLHRE